MGIFQKFTNFLHEDEEDFSQMDDFQEYDSSQTSPNQENESRQTSQTRQGHRANNVVPLTKTVNRQPSKIFVVEPKVYSEVERISDSLLSGETVLLNFRRLEAADARRIIDFMAGIAYAIGGDVQKVRDGIFICSPANVRVEGVFEDELDQDGLY